MDNISIKGHLTVKVRRVDSDDFITVCDIDNLLTTNGKDWVHSQLYNSGTSNEAVYIALTSNSDVPAVSDTILTGEIVSDGLERAAGTVSHTLGTSITSITHGFTSSGTHTDVQKAGLFTQISGGVMVHEAAFGASVSLGVGDQINVTWTITLS